MGLRDRYQKQEQPGTESTLPHGTATWGPAYDRPIQAEVEGEPVRIIQAGNVVGMSPVFLCVDAEGTAAFVAIREVRITDPSVLPTVQLARGKMAPR